MMRFKRLSNKFKTGMLAVFFLGALIITFSGTILCGVGEFLVSDELPITSDAIVVLNTGVEYYPRLIEAANLYHQGLAGRIVINGNRKTKILRQLEARGFKSCCQWYEDRLRILELQGVPREKVISISAEDVYDTVGEAAAVGSELVNSGMKKIILTTSKSHTRRAGHIWKAAFGNQLLIYTVAARTDPYDPQGWWRSGRQIRWVLSEYGAWLYYYWKRITGDMAGDTA
jgi:uncharacterized SAM-binding protein YcdF (DUF218 family)